jgi:hypothetical protein
MDITYIKCTFFIHNTAYLLLSYEQFLGIMDLLYIEHDTFDRSRRKQEEQKASETLHRRLGGIPK